jgi:hypothetical protein
MSGSNFRKTSIEFSSSSKEYVVINLNFFYS